MWRKSLRRNKKAFPTAANSPCKRYSNTEHGTQQHEYGENSVCIYCGKPSIAYTVTIPATVALGNENTQTADITAQDITLPVNHTLKVTVNGPFTVSVDKTTP